MKRILIIIVLALIAGCRSHKEICSAEETYNYSDSITAQTDFQSVSVQNETIKTLVLSEEKGERVEFIDEGGEIEFNPDGKVTLKGVAAYAISDVATMRNSNLQSSLTDTMQMHSTTGISQKSSATSSFNSEKKPESKSHSLKILLLIALLIGCTSIALYLRKKVL